MSRLRFATLLVLVGLAALGGVGLARRRPAAAAISTASSQCAPLDANTVMCSLSLDGSLQAGETVTVAISTGALSQASYSSGCQPSGALNPPAIAAGGGSFSFTAPDGACAGPIAFSETVSGLTAPGTLVQSVTDSGAAGLVVNTAVFLVSFSGSKTCTAGATAGAFACQLTVNASSTMAGTMLSVSLSDGTFTSVTYMSGCATTPAITVSPTSFDLTTPGGGCGGSGGLVLNETVAGVSGSSLTQTLSASGTFSGLGSFTAQLPAQQQGGALTLSGSKTCAAANADDGNGGGDDNGDDRAYADDGSQAAMVSCTLTLQPSAPLAAGATVTVTISGNAGFASATYTSGCASAPSPTVGNGSFSFAVPAGGCAGPLVFAESLNVTGSGGALAQAVTIAGASSGSATIQATNSDGSAFTLPSSQAGNGNDNGEDNGNANGQNHSVPACQNSRGRAPQRNPHCQGGSD